MIEYTVKASEETTMWCLNDHEISTLILLDGLEIDLPLEIEYAYQPYEPDSLEYQGCSEAVLLEDILLSGVSIINALNDTQIKEIQSRLLETLKTNEEF